MLAVIRLVMSKSGGGPIAIGGDKTSIGGEALLAGGDSSGCSTTTGGETGAVEAVLSMVRALLTASCKLKNYIFDLELIKILN